MEFRDTGLPADPLVYRAFEMYRKNRDHLPPHIRDFDAPVRRAVILHQCEAPKETIAFALVSDMLFSSWVFAGHRLGPEAGALARDVVEQIGASFINIGGASDQTKIFLMAMDIVAMMAVLDE